MRGGFGRPLYFVSGYRNLVVLSKEDRKREKQRRKEQAKKAWAERQQQRLQEIAEINRELEAMRKSQE